MALKEIVTLDAEVTIALGGLNTKTKKKNPEHAEGYYLGSRSVSSPRSKTGFALIHFLLTPKGKLGIWGKTDLDKKLARVKPGSRTVIDFSGMISMPNGSMYTFRVSSDDDDTVEVADGGLSAGTDSDKGSTYDAGDDGDTSTDDDDDTGASYEAEERTQNTALSALERKQKVEALLKNKGQTKRN